MARADRDAPLSHRPQPKRRIRALERSAELDAASEGAELTGRLVNLLSYDA